MKKNRFWISFGKIDLVRFELIFFFCDSHVYKHFKKLYLLFLKYLFYMHSY